ncbi:MAG: VIT domain-containing protein, partial [Myxococcota bacterium]
QGEGLRVDGVTAQSGAAIAQGGRVQTDERTRAAVELSDGSRIVLDRGTTISLEPSGRDVRLHAGVLVADIAHLESGPTARFLTDAGEVEVLGTKFVLTADGDEGSVQVTRGVVRVRGGGESAQVKAGEEALFRRDSAPRVQGASQLAASVGWSELETADPTEGVPGLGELRARRPGEREEQERPLRLADHRVTTRIVGPVARTEVHEVFRNDSNDVLEGEYLFPLPAGARIARLLLKVDGEWEEGAFVDKMRGERIWRGVIRNATPDRRRAPELEEWIWVPGPWRDPALLEWQQGGRFKLRIFPIPARGAREIRIVYEENVPVHADGRRYVYPLPITSSGSDAAEHFSVNVSVAEGSQAKARGYEMQQEGNRLSFEANDFAPAGDLIVDYRDAEGPANVRLWTFRGDASAAPPSSRPRNDRARAIRDQMAALDRDERGYALLALRPELPLAERPPSSDYLVVVDTSQSMVGERLRRASEVVGTMTREMDRRDRVLVAACDLHCRLSGEPTRPSPDAASELAEFITKDGAAGSSNLAFAIARSVELAQAAGAGSGRPLHVVYVGDGIASAGPSTPAGLRIMSEESARGRYTLTTVGIGQDADDRALRAMAGTAGGHYVAYTPGRSTLETAMAVLESTYGARLEGASVELPAGLELAVPARLPTLRHGEEVLVAARVTGERIDGEVVLRGKVGTQPFESRHRVSTDVSDAAGNAFVPRVWATQRIADLELEGGQDEAVTALSKSYSVMSRSTSLIVLESNAMFEAFGVDRERGSVEWTGEEPSESVSAGALGALGDASSTNGLSAFGSGGGRRASRMRRPPTRPRPTAAPAPALDDQMGVLLARPEMNERREQSARAADGRAESEAQQAAPAARTRRARRRGGSWRRRVVTREGRVSGSVNLERARAAVRDADARLAASPDSRDRHRELVRALSRAGELERAETVARSWLERDALDWEALTYLADAVGRQGRREAALRLLSGVLDLQPDSELLQTRLARAFERFGNEAAACAHWTRLAELEGLGQRASNRGRRRRARAAAAPETLVRAVRCQRAQSRTELVNDYILANTSDTLRTRINDAAARRAEGERQRGAIRLDATWQSEGTPVDVDLSLITRQGTRVSWMGGLRAAFGEDGSSTSRERLGLRTARVGTYQIEVQRTDVSARVSGQVRVNVHGETRTLPFTLQAGQNRVSVGAASIERRTRWETVNGPWRP